MSTETDERKKYSQRIDERKKYKQHKLDCITFDILMKEYNLCTTDISLSSQNLNSNAMKIIGEWLKNNTTLKSLDLNQNRIYDAGASELTKALRVNTTLTTLDLEYNGIGNSGANAFFKMLQTTNTITSLCLKNNHISDIGIVSLENNTSLTTLDLAYNKIDNAGLVSLVESIKLNRGLTKLVLNGNIIGDSGDAFTTLFKNNSTLRVLMMNYCNFTQGVFDAFIDILKMPSFALEEFIITTWFEDIEINPYNVHFNYDKLFDAIKYNTTLQEFFFNIVGVDNDLAVLHNKTKTINEVIERNKFFKYIFHLMCCVEHRGMYLPDEIWTKVAYLS
jgi:Ran GTPase-activating protein (RanGAP) involved in mRNA processing and transport